MNRTVIDEAARRLYALGLMTLALAPGLTGCDGGPNDAAYAQPVDAAAAAGPTWTNGIQAIVAVRCTGCHTPTGVAPFPLVTHDDVLSAAPAVAASVRAGTMPPTRTRADCRSFENDHRMPDDEREALLAWLDDGAPLGETDGLVPTTPPAAALDAPDIRLQPAKAYTPSADRIDDYRCLPLGEPFAATAWVTAHAFEPDVNEQVHHVIFYLVPPDAVADMAAADAAAEGPGYPCYGSSGFGGQQMGVWAPGGGPQYFPDGAAFEVPAGSQIVAQMHYNAPPGEGLPDRSALLLQTADTAPPLRVTMPIFGGFFRVPAGDPAATFAFDFRFPADMADKRIFAVMPHMHRIGREMTVELERADGDACLVDVRDWAFEWQQFYDLGAPGVAVSGGDTLRYRCTFDNGDGDAPVEFGEGSDDEMCLVVLAMVGPPDAEQATACPDYASCRDGCADPDGAGCYLDCAPAQPDACSSCLLQGVGECGQTHCGPEFGAMIGCVSQSCTVDLMDAAGMMQCLAGPCREPFEASWACVRPLLDSGECEGFEACGAVP